MKLFFEKVGNRSRGFVETNKSCGLRTYCHAKY